jgi:hypothetical protein
MEQIEESRKIEALKLLKGLAECLFTINADIFYEALDESGFSEDERTRLVGSSFRTAACRRWITKTDFSTKSRRNSSNIQNVWISNLFKKTSESGPESQNRILSAYSYWNKKGLLPPDHFGRMWAKLRFGLQ